MAYAQVPYSTIDQLRTKNVVSRVALDFPNSPKIKTCKMKTVPFADIGAKLAVQTESMKAEWSKGHLYGPDISGLKAKVKVCEIRGSCSAYSDFLSSVHGSEAEVQKEMDAILKTLEEKQTTMKSIAYLKAWAYVPKPCEVLKSLIK